MKQRGSAAHGGGPDGAINTAYLSEFYGPTRPETSRAQAFTFLVRDQRLGANVGSAQGPQFSPKARLLDKSETTISLLNLGPNMQKGSLIS
ncbi:hypothetical protein LguiB_009398 [Lonicera macranthoides]